MEGIEYAFSPEGKIGKFMRQEMNLTMVVDDTIYAHAGVFPEHVAEGVDKLNERARQLLLDTPSVEELYQLYLNNITHPIFTDEIFLGNKSALDNKYLSDYPESEMCSVLEETLKLTNTKRMIVGHTVQFYGKINTKCNNKLILIDVGISRCIGGGFYGYVEILNDKKEIWARYLKHN